MPDFLLADVAAGVDDDADGVAAAGGPPLWSSKAAICGNMVTIGINSSSCDYAIIIT